MQIFSSAMSRNKFSTNSMAQYQNFSADTSMTVSAPLHVADPSSTDSSNTFHPALEFTWEISTSGVTFLDINVSIQNDGLATSVHYKPTDSHSYLLHSSSHLPHVKNSIPYSQFLRLRRLCSDDTDFSAKADEMRNFFAERNYPNSVVTDALERVHNISRETALKPSESKSEDRIPLTITYHPNNLRVKDIILKNFKLLQSDPKNHHSSHSNETRACAIP